jgi:hypothetical protein
MDAVLVTLGVLGLGAIIISAYVFTVAARNYVSDDHSSKRNQPDGEPVPFVDKRSGTDRRQADPVAFPLKLHGRLILEDRRVNPDRREAA